MKKKLPTFYSDDDFLKEFQKDPVSGNDENGSGLNRKNRHGVRILEPGNDCLPGCPEDGRFEELLEASFKEKKKSKKSQPPSIPLKKRLKRYPPVEIELDLHGFTAVGAQVRTRSFISSCRQQGFFTVKIIVGKGLHSEMGAVLPDVVEDVVKEMKHQGLVLSYGWEKKKKSKSGALIVYIRQFEQYDYSK